MVASMISKRFVECHNATSAKGAHFEPSESVLYRFVNTDIRSSWIKTFGALNIEILTFGSSNIVHCSNNDLTLYTTQWCRFSDRR